MQRLLPIATVIAATAVAACGSGDPSGSAPTSSAESAEHIPSPIGTPVHPILEPTPCPQGDTCSVSAVNLQPPFSGCSTPSWFTESGATTAAYAVSLCPTGAALTTWLSNEPASWVTTTSTVPYFYAATAGYTYVTFAGSIPGLMPVSPTCSRDGTCPFAEGILWTDSSGNALPCSQVYSIPADNPEAGFYAPGGMWAAYCLETPAVDAWKTDFKPSNIYEHAGEVTLPADVALAAPYGYVYLAWWSDLKIVVIGNGCSSSCIHL